jgi:hypothetical protein
MQLPQTVQVGPYRYRLEVDGAAIAQARSEERDDRVGHHDAKASRLVVDPDQSADCVADTVLHELLHAIWFMAGLQQGRAAPYEESVVATLSPALLDTLRRNPELVAFLAAATEAPDG